MPQLKPYIQQLLAADQTSEAIDYLLAVELADKDNTTDFRNVIVLQSGRYQNYRRLIRENTEDFADLVRIRNSVNLALLEILEELPDDYPLPAVVEEKKPSGVSENRLKNRLLWLVAIAKLIVIGFAFTLWESGTFTNAQFVATVTLLLPIFVTYLSLMVKDQTQRMEAIEHPDKRVTKRFERMTYLLIIGYMLALLFIINLRGPGTISFEMMNGMLAAVESGLGVYVTQVVFAIFKKTTG